MHDSEIHPARDFADFACRLSAAREQSAIIDEVLQYAGSALHADGVTFVLRENDRCYCADEDAVQPLWKGRRFSLSSCVDGWVMLNKQSLSITDIYADDRVPRDFYKSTFVKSMLMVPIRRDSPIGAVGAYWARSHTPQKAEQRLLEAIADTTAIVIENVRTSEELAVHAQDLANERRRLKTIVQAARVGTWEWDVGEDTIIWSDEALEIMGIDKEPVSGTFDEMEKLVYPEDRSYWKESVRACVEDGIAHQIDFRVCLPGGETRWVAARGNAERDGRGNAVRMMGTVMNITRRKQTEELLRDTVQFNDRMSKVAPVLLYILDIASGTNVFTNQSTGGFLGYTRQQSQEIGDAVYKQLMHPEDKVRFAEHVARLSDLPDACVAVFEYRMKANDGSWRWYLSRDTVFMRDKEGKPQQILGAAIDITKRKHTEQELWRQAQIISQVHDSIVTTDTEGRITGWNDGARKLHGFSDDEVMGRDVGILFPAEYASIFQEMVAKEHAQSETFSLELPVRVKNKESLWCHLSISLLRDSSGAPIGTVGYAIDISSRKQMEDSLRLSEHRYRKAQQVGHVGSWEYDIQSDTFWGSEEGLRIYGFEESVDSYSAEKVMERVVERARVEQAMVDLIRHDKPYDIEFDIVRADASELRTVRSLAELQRDEKGNPVKVTGVLLDITETKRLNERIRQAEKMEAIGSLAGGIAHDFNNILGGIIGYADMALAELPSGSYLEKHLSRILQASDRAKNLVRQILAFSRRGKELKSPQYLRPVIKEVVDLLRASLPSTITIKDTIVKDTLPVMADPTKIHEIVMNLCTNAAHAMNEKGTLEIEYAEEEVATEIAGRTGGVSPGTYSVITVRDTGSGMDEATCAKIFDPFFTTKQPGQGTGMGLAVVFGIVQSHNGGVTVASAPGMGTTFKVYLPKCGETVQTEKESDRRASGGRERILVVDDEEIMCELCTDMLTGLGYKVKAFTNSPAALEYFLNHPNSFDLVITDQTMPTLTGLELSMKLRELRPALPILIATGYSKTVDEHIALAAGISGYIDKPYRLRDIAHKIRAVLDTCGRES